MTTSQDSPAYVSDDRVAIVGAGRVGTSIGLLLKSAGHPIVGCSTRSSRTLDRAVKSLSCTGTTSARDAVAGADIVVIAVPDDAVGRIATDLVGAVGDGTFVFHTAGSLGVEPLGELAAAGADVLAIHPLQSIPSVAEGVKRMKGSYFGVTAEPRLLDWGRGIVDGLGGKFLHVEEADRTIYHACAVIVSNYLVLLSALIEQEGRALEPYLPLMKGTLQNLSELPPLEAMTGPIARGDSGTVHKHLRVLSEETSAIYRSLGEAAISILRSGGRLDDEAESRLREALE
jgi:predicted short-subunit dehydrogenase-like oxidoreductase (DUF2520 family)